LVALSKLYYLYSKEEQVDRLTYARVVEVKRLAAKERSYTFKAWVAALAHLFYLKKVYKKVHLKEYYLIKQGLYKLKGKEGNFNYPVVEINPNSLVVRFSLVPRSPLTNLFFNPSFSLLPVLVSSNTP